MNALELMKKDHRKVEELFKALSETTEKGEKKRGELFDQLKRELDAHAHMEELVFYPATQEASQTHQLTLEAYEEHNQVKGILEEMALAPKGTEEWAAKCKVLNENVSHHVKEEENELFPKVKKLMSSEELETLGVRMEEVKNAFLSGFELAD